MIYTTEEPRKKDGEHEVLSNCFKLIRNVRSLMVFTIIINKRDSLFFCSSLLFFCGVISGVSKAVDLCAAPGSWSQVLVLKLK